MGASGEGRGFWGMEKPGGVPAIRRSQMNTALRRAGREITCNHVGAQDGTRIITRL